MKRLLVIILSSLFISAQPETGLGIVEVDIYNTRQLKLFNDPNDAAPEKIITLAKENGDIVITTKDYNKWLKPEGIWLDYSIFIFRYTEVKGKWTRVIINHETGEKKWLELTATLSSNPWSKFLVENTTAVEPMSPTDIKSEPNANSKTIRKSTEQDCFEAIEVKGDWIKIKTNDTLDCNEHPEPLEGGWIKWKSNNQLQIRFFLTC